MANKYQEDLKRIVGVSDKVGGIAAPREKQAIAGGRGIVYFDKDGESKTKSGTPGETMQPGADSTTGGTDGGQANGSSSAGGSNGGNTSSSEGIDGPYPVDDATAAGSGVFSITDLHLGDQVNAISGLQDCATGDPVSVRFDGQFTAPAGWAAPDTPPLVEGYTEGSFWYDDYTTERASSPNGVMLIKYDPAVYYWVTASSGPSSWTYNLYRVSDDGWVGVINLGLQTCSVAPNEDYCTVVPYETGWPASQPMQLSYNSETGKYETNSLDSNVTPEYSQPVSSFSLCNSAGDPIKSYPTADGGQAIQNETTGIATFIDANGKVTGFGDAQAITNNLPR